MFTLLGDTLFALSFLFYPAMAALLDFLLEILATIAVTYTFVCRLIPSPSTVSFFLLVLEMILQYSLECSTRLLFIRISGLSLAGLASLMLKEYLQETMSVVSQYAIAVHDVVIDPAVHTFMWSLVGFAIMGLEYAHELYVSAGNHKDSIPTLPTSCASSFGDLSDTIAKSVSHLDIEAETHKAVKRLNPEARPFLSSLPALQALARKVVLNPLALEFVPGCAQAKIDINTVDDGSRLNPLAKPFVPTCIVPSETTASSSTVNDSSFAFAPVLRDSLACRSPLNASAPIFVPGLSINTVEEKATFKSGLNALAKKFVSTLAHPSVHAPPLNPTAAIFIPRQTAAIPKASLNASAPAFTPAHTSASTASSAPSFSDASVSLSSTDGFPFSTSFTSFHFADSVGVDRQGLRHSVSFGSLAANRAASPLPASSSIPFSPGSSSSDDASLTLVDAQSFNDFSSFICRGVKTLGSLGISASASMPLEIVRL
ncbi:hypothetical protein BV25DRAFT_1824380 [Artomyces pyxidatus]|uniref:Uncharacterized protein n=1 Tax=Artomyces pyxidatus TaxID=48021 RepID=A0ACB8T3R1_9AGAM|nr:hypothetical protein BV25DRAFT_1824380 [Artomyces pyxidatus]